MATICVKIRIQEEEKINPDMPVKKGGNFRTFHGYAKLNTPGAGVVWATLPQKHQKRARTDRYPYESRRA